jgi:RNA polymerase sigma-70 factor, ECF subfamily
MDVQPGRVTMIQDESVGSEDVAVIQCILTGDVDEFRHIMVKYKDLVMRIVRRRVPPQDVAEVAQDVFVKAYQSLGSFKQKGDFSHWLSSVAVKTCYTFWRNTYRVREVPMANLSERHQEWLEEVLSERSEESLVEKSAQEEARELLDWALGQLGAKDRLVMELVYLEGRSVKEAADLLGWSVANVKVRTFRSRRKLEKLLIAQDKE